MRIGSAAPSNPRRRSVGRAAPAQADIRSYDLHVAAALKPESWTRTVRPPSWRMTPDGTPPTAASGRSSLAEGRFEDRRRGQHRSVPRLLPASPKRCRSSSSRSSIPRGAGTRRPVAAGPTGIRSAGRRRLRLCPKAGCLRVGSRENTGMPGSDPIKQAPLFIPWVHADPGRRAAR